MNRSPGLKVLVVALVGFTLLGLLERARGDDLPSSGVAVSSTTPDATVPPGTAAESAPTPPGAGIVAVAMPPTSQLDTARVKLEPALSIDKVTGMIWNEVEQAYYVISQDGKVYLVDEGLTSSEVVMDLAGEVTPWMEGSERGLLGVEFDPRNDRMFLYYTDLGDDTNVASYAMTNGRPDPASRRLVLFQEQPGLGHKAGTLWFMDDGVLFIAVGDGGGSNGRDAQDYTKILGGIIRIVPRTDAEGYDIPPDNPYVGDSTKRPEIWAKGLRNPWRFSIDPGTGDMYIGDVGHDSFEEIDRIPAGTSGQNFGWVFFEGSKQRYEGAPADVVPPIYEYPHSVGPAVIGGFVYYGSAIPALRGSYVFCDMTGVYFAMGSDGVVTLPIKNSDVSTGWAESPDRELFLFTLRGGIFRLLPA